MHQPSSNPKLPLGTFSSHLMGGGNRKGRWQEEGGEAGMEEGRRFLYLHFCIG